jgi:hypothetical protein
MRGGVRTECGRLPRAPRGGRGMRAVNETRWQQPEEPR